jgi:hypothetical protein
MRAHPAIGPASMTVFTTVAGNKTVLMLQVMQGRLVEAMWNRTKARAAALPGVGDGAWARGNRCGARRGNVFVALSLAGPAKKNPTPLPVLLGQAVARLPQQASPVD